MQFFQSSEGEGHGPSGPMVSTLGARSCRCSWNDWSPGPTRSVFIVRHANKIYGSSSRYSSACDMYFYTGSFYESWFFCHFQLDLVSKNYGVQIFSTLDDILLFRQPKRHYSNKLNMSLACRPTSAVGTTPIKQSRTNRLITLCQQCVVFRT